MDQGLIKPVLALLSPAALGLGIETNIHVLRMFRVHKRMDIEMPLNFVFLQNLILSPINAEVINSVDFT